MQQFIEDTPAEQEARQRYTARVAALEGQRMVLAARCQQHYAASSLAYFWEQIAQVNAELRRVQEEESQRVAAL